MKRKGRLGLVLSLITALVICVFTGCISFRFNSYGLAEVEVFHHKLGVSSCFDDGPYVVEEDGQWYSLGVVAGEAKKQIINSAPAEPVTEPAVYENVEHIAVVSDIHGQYDVFIELLQANGIINEELNWAFKAGHLVVLGDVFDRGHAVTECLWLIYKLEIQAAESGGKVHFVWGNHELMVWKSDLAFTNHKYLKTAEILQMPYTDLYAPSTLLGRWLLSKPVMLKINDCLFVHAGISRAVADRVPHIDSMNTLYRLALRKESKTKSDDWLLGPMGVLWYRGFLKDPDYNQQLDTILEQYGANYLISGHTTHSHIQELYGGRMYLIDAGIKYGKRGEMLYIDKGAFSVKNEEGETIRARNP